MGMRDVVGVVGWMGEYRQKQQHALKTNYPG